MVVGECSAIPFGQGFRRRFVLNADAGLAVQLPAWEEAVTVVEMRRSGGRWSCAPGARALLEAHEAAGSPLKELLVIPEAGHNDLLAAGMTPYFETLAAFAARCDQG